MPMNQPFGVHAAMFVGEHLFFLCQAIDQELTCFTFLFVQDLVDALGIEDGLAERRLVDRLAAVLIQRRLGIETLHMAEPANEKNPDDGRSVLIKLTDYGKEMREVSREHVITFNKKVHEHLSAEKLQHFFEVTEKINQLIAERSIYEEVPSKAL